MLDNKVLKDIINEWSYWERSPIPSIPRSFLNSSLSPLAPDLVLVIQGIRRCGKSTLLSQLMTFLKLDPRNCFFVNFEDPRLSQDLTYELLDQIINLAKKERPTKTPLYFFFDEIQEVQNWQKWFHRCLERPTQDCFIITGSNASILSGELASTLTGRHRTLELFPFSWAEYKILKPNSFFENYIEEGGFPRILIEKNPQELLREYFTDIIERDVRRHVSARSSMALSRLVKAVFESTGSEISQRSLAGMLGITTDTVGTYLWACEASYLLLPCPYFTFSEKQRTARNRKFYPIDLGLRNAIVTKTGFDRGKKLETIVFHHLRKKYREVYYWREKGEVDFVILDSEGLTPYQVTWDTPIDRHYKALDEFYRKYPDAKPSKIITRKNIEEFLES